MKDTRSDASRDGPKILGFLEDDLADLREKGLFRELRRVEKVRGMRLRIGEREVVNFGSNNYLGIADHPVLLDAAQRAMREFGFGSGASRLVSGNTEAHEELEQRIARFLGTEAAIVFGSGYLANLGTISALVGRSDAVICDRLNHASLIDGCRLSGARLRTYRHCDPDHLESALRQSQNARRRLVVTDSVFSVDGDLAPLREIAEIAERHEALLMVDEAHATGVFGAHGRGLTEHMNIERGIHVHMGTLSKAVGAIGGYVAGSRALVELLRNRARSFIYTTALPAACAAAAIAGLDLLEQGHELRRRLWENVHIAQIGLREMGCDIGRSASQIIPVILGEPQRAIDVAQSLMRAGFLVPALRPPTVPPGTSRLRISITSSHTPEEIQGLLAALRDGLGRKNEPDSPSGGLLR